MRVVPFEAEHVAEASALFVASLNQLRGNVPALSAGLAEEGVIATRLAAMMNGYAALENDRLVGFLTSWFPIASFRDTERSGAYVPAWGHGAGGDDIAAVYRVLYRAASEEWAAEGCGVHAITTLANDTAARDAWFWSGFGLGTIDAVRAMRSLATPPPTGYRVRQAEIEDANSLAILDAEHVRHYETPPVFMARRDPVDAEGWRLFLSQAPNGAWLAEDADGPFGFMRFGTDFGGSDVTAATDGMFIDGAYVRATHRRRGAADALLDAALQHYASQGLTSCVVDFEAFNPEAAAFWLRSFTPVCYSLMRVPEAVTV